MATLDLTVDDGDLRRLQKRLEDAYPERLRRRLQQVVEATARKVQDDARANVPVDTSNLQSSIQIDLSEIDDLKARVGSALEYARNIEIGFTGTQEVDAHKRTVTELFGEPLDKPTVFEIEAHERQVDRKGTFYLTKAVVSQKKPHERRLEKAIEIAGDDIAA